MLHGLNMLFVDIRLPDMLPGLKKLIVDLCFLDMLHGLKKLTVNASLVLVLVGFCCDTYIYGGFLAFLSKYLEVAFNLSPYVANMYSGEYVSLLLRALALVVGFCEMTFTPRHKNHVNDLQVVYLFQLYTFKLHSIHTYGDVMQRNRRTFF